MRRSFIAVLVGGSLVALSCAPSAARKGPPEPSRAGEIESPPAQAPIPAPRPPRMPGPAAARMHEAVEANRECESCHEAEASEWRGSLHRRANVEPSYRRAFAREPMPFCRSCHAPESIPNELPPEDVGEMGVGCVTCHVTDDHVLAAPLGDDAPPRAAAPHRVVRDARFAGVDACGSCHEFRFPTAHGDDDASFMQTTVREHASSAERDTSCAGCHMPLREDGRRSHVFLGSRDEAFVRSSVRVTAERVSRSEVRIRLEPVASGHAFPTGDLFRRIEITAEALGPDYMVLSEAHRYLGRHWALRAHGEGRELLRDDRLRDEPMTVALNVGPEATGRPIAWRVAYQRVAHANGVDEADATVDAEIVLGSGIFNFESNEP